MAMKAIKRLSILTNNLSEFLFNSKYVNLHPKDINETVLKQLYDVKLSLVGIKSDKDKIDHERFMNFHKGQEVYISVVTSKSDNDIVGYISWKKVNLFDHKKWDKNIIMEGGYMFFRSVQKTDKDGNIKRYSNPFLGMYTPFHVFYNLAKVYPTSKFDHYFVARMYPGSYLSVYSVFSELVCLKDEINDFQKEALENYFKLYHPNDPVSHLSVLETKPLASEVSKAPKSKRNQMLYKKYISLNPNFADGIGIACISRMSISLTLKSLLSKYFS